MPLNPNAPGNMTVAVLIIHIEEFVVAVGNVVGKKLVHFVPHFLRGVVRGGVSSGVWGQLWSLM